MNRLFTKNILVLFVSLMAVGAAISNPVENINAVQDPTSTYVVVFNSTTVSTAYDMYDARDQMTKNGTSGNPKYLFFCKKVTMAASGAGYTFPITRNTAFDGGYAAWITNAYVFGNTKNIQYVKAVFTGTAPKIRGTKSGAFGAETAMISGVSTTAATLLVGTTFTYIDKFEIALPINIYDTSITSIEVGYNC